MKTKITIIAVIIVGLSLITYAYIPQLINFQGKATNTLGAPLNGTFDLAFRIYNHESSGDLKWQETHQDIAISNGIFQVLLGSASTLDLPFDEDYWISVEVNTDGEMTPRTRLAAVGYAYISKISDNSLRANVADTIDANGIITAHGGLVIETRTSDPESPITGQIWLRTDQ